MADVQQITLYFVGWNESEARHGFVFDTEDSALAYAQDCGEFEGDKIFIPNVYAAPALVNFDEMEEIA